MRAVGASYRAAGVEVIYLVHGTFFGSDAVGILSAVGRIFPAAENLAGVIGKLCLDKLTGDAGNYTEQFARVFEAAINPPGERPIAVRRFIWSSQNNHLGRADGAVRLIEELAALDLPPDGRVLLWGHSHAGNLFALLTNLLAADAETRDEFFEATEIFYRGPILRKLDVPVWDRVRKLLAAQPLKLRGEQLDLVTFGTPLRYGWDAAGYARLLHVVNHVPCDELPPYRAPFPPAPDRVLTAADGDYIQQLGIAGTNLIPNPLAWRCWIAERRLNTLLQTGVEPVDLLARFRPGCRVADEGTTLLVNYGPASGNIGQHLAGHAVYTRAAWLVFHAEQVAERFYGDRNSVQ